MLLGNFYLDGIGSISCYWSRRCQDMDARQAAREMGYLYLMIYQAGMPDWLLQGNPVQKGSKPGRLK